MDDERKILDDNKMKVDFYYGGKQDWLRTQNYVPELMANKSCGAAVISNICHYMSYSDVRFKKIVNKPLNNKESYTFFMNEIYEAIRPKIWGVPSIGLIVYRFRTFAKKQGIKLDYKKLIVTGNLEEVVLFIKEALGKDIPLALITWNSKNKELSNHWVTVTGIYKEDNEYYFVTSNWGKKKVYNLNTWVKQYSIYKGILYFY